MSQVTPAQAANSFGMSMVTPKQVVATSSFSSTSKRKRSQDGTSPSLISENGYHSNSGDEAEIETSPKEQRLKHFASFGSPSTKSSGEDPNSVMDILLKLSQHPPSPAVLSRVTPSTSTSTSTSSTTSTSNRGNFLADQTSLYSNSFPDTPYSNNARLKSLMASSAKDSNYRQTLALLQTPRSNSSMNLDLSMVMTPMQPPPKMMIDDMMTAECNGEYTLLHMS